MRDAAESLAVTLPGVVSWSRPRLAHGGVRYPAAYARSRDEWAAVVRAAVGAQGWHPPPEARYRVAVVVSGGGKRDLDRVCTAVLDALQGGGAVRDDCLVDDLTAVRCPVGHGNAPATTVEIATVPPARRRGSATGGRS